MDVIQQDSLIHRSMEGVGIYIWGSILVCLFTVVCVLVASIARPNDQIIVTTIISITGPITTALLAAGIHGIYRGVEGRFSQLLGTTAELSRSQGKGEVIRNMYWQLSTMEPGTDDYNKLLNQIQIESRIHFDAIDKRNK